MPRISPGFGVVEVENYLEAKPRALASDANSIALFGNLSSDIWKLSRTREQPCSLKMDKWCRALITRPTSTQILRLLEKMVDAELEPCDFAIGRPCLMIRSTFYQNVN